MYKVALLGRPNTGKSSLFNKLTGRKTSIVHNSPGVTRDRLYGDVEWNGINFKLIDTGGIVPLAELKNEKNPAVLTDDDLKNDTNFNSSYFILSRIKKQAEIALEEADVVVIVCDLQTGVTTDDIEVAKLLTRSNKRTILVVNKCDAVGGPPSEIYDFYSLGLGEPLPVSAFHGHGTGDLLDEMVKGIKREEVSEVYDEANGEAKSEDSNEQKTIKISVIGKPNSGKSTFVNYLAGEERSLVSEKAGTTRDAFDIPITVNGKNYILTDTAGIRKKKNFNEINFGSDKAEDYILEIEKYSLLRAFNAVDNSDAVIIMLDGLEGFTEQDGKIAGYAHERGKPSIIAVNKWDAVPDKQTDTIENTRKKLLSNYAFMSYVPFAFISAKNGTRVKEVFKIIDKVYSQNSKRITTGLLNEFISSAIKQKPPPSKRGKRLKIYYVTQISANPPDFAIFVNEFELFHFSYQRYIENRIREAFGLDSTPVKITIREKKSD